MVKFKPFEYPVSFPNKLKFKKSTLKLILGALLMTFFLNYQPTLGFPPVKKIDKTHAQELNQQVQQIDKASLPFQFQLPHAGYITTTFSTYHPGIDLCTGLGMPIKPIAPGVITEAGYNFWGLGLIVEIDHGQGYKSLYAHMGKTYVTKGKTVDENSFIGEVGLTGHTSGPHTHLEIFKEGNRINPLAILPEIRNYPTEQDFVVHNSATPSAVLIPKPQPISTPAINAVPPSPSPSAKPEQLTSLFNLPATPKTETQPKLSNPLKNYLNPNLLH